MTAWLDDLQDIGRNGDDAVLVTITGVRGSAPRDVGTRMVVTRRESIGTIGGGQLEFQCTRIACEQLAARTGQAAVTNPRRFVLGSNCGQCCGGVVDVQFENVTADKGWVSALAACRESGQEMVLATALEAPSCKYVVTLENCERIGDEAACPSPVLAAARDLIATGGNVRLSDGYLLEAIRPCDFNIAVFGAGHVGTEIVALLSRLDCNVRWIDNRHRVFPETVPANVLPIESTEPAREVAALPANAFFLVMTQSHPLDLDITARILARGDSAYCGLIGSVSKRRRFERLLKKQGIGSGALETLICPIGVTGIASKKPAEIAFAVVTEILQRREAKLCVAEPAAPALRPVG